MAMILMDILLVLASAGGGFAGAWYLNRRRPVTPEATDASNVAEQAIARLQELTKRISADVVDHNSRVQEISNGLGDGTEITAESLAQAVAALISVNETMQTQLSSAEQRLQDQAREIESHVAEARTDALTALGNRRAFDTEMERGYSDYQRRGRPLSVLIIDVDHFKSFNDTHGHQAGDEVLRRVGRVLMQNSLAEHVVCRYGGEEFAIIFPGATMADAAAAAEGARSAIADHTVEFEGKKLKVTASAGLAQLLPNESIDDLVKRADEALYASKEEGRNCGHAHDGEIFFPITRLLTSPAEQVPPAAVAAPTVPDDVSALASAAGERFDRLMGLSTMTAFSSDLERRLCETKRSGAPISMLIARIDNYEELLAKYDEKSATMVLRAAAQFFKATMRDMDHLACEEDDSFALLLPTATLENAQKVAERLRGAVYRCKLPLGGKPFQFTMSFGVAQASREDCCETLIQRSKAAQCQAVLLGGNRCFADELPALEPVS